MKDPVTWLYPPIEPYNTGRLQVSPSTRSISRKRQPLRQACDLSARRSRRRFRSQTAPLLPSREVPASSTSTSAAAPEHALRVSRSHTPGTSSPISRSSARTWASIAGRCSADRGAPPSPSPIPKLIRARHRTRSPRHLLLRKQEIDWFYQRGASVLYPDAWEPYLAHIPEAERGDLLSAYYRRLTSDDAAVRLAAAKIWSGWRALPPSSCPTPISPATTKRMSSPSPSRALRSTTSSTRGFSKPTTSCSRTLRASATSPE